MSGPPLSRRTAVLGAGLLSVAAAAIGGCDLDLGSAPAPAAAPPPDPDERILRSGRAELTVLVARVRATRDASPRAGGDALLGELEQAHLAQLAALGGTTPPASSAARPLRARRLLLAREQLAAARFATWAERAESGDLARVLAATSAGIATYLSGLPGASGQGVR